MKASSIGKAAAVASTALLMGAYVWHQARQGAPEAIGDPAATAAAAAQPEDGQIQFTTIPGIPVNPDVAGQNIQTFPGSKSAMVFPGSKSDTIVPFPGSKSGTVVLPIPGPDNNLPPTKPTVLPGSKSLSVVFDEKTLQRIAEEAKEAEKKGDPATPFLPGSKVKVPIIPPQPAPATGEPSEEGQGDDQPAEEPAEK